MWLGRIWRRIGTGRYGLVIWETVVYVYGGGLTWILVFHSSSTDFDVAVVPLFVLFVGVGLGFGAEEEELSKARSSTLKCSDSTIKAALQISWNAVKDLARERCT